jgi:hypothetical protein
MADEAAGRRAKRKRGEEGLEVEDEGGFVILEHSP